MNAPSTPNATTDSDSTPNATTDSEQAFVIWTNLFYTVAGIAILWLGQTMLHAALAIALGLLAGASWHYHDRLTKDSLLLDFVGMMAVGTTLAGFALHAAAGGEASWWLMGEVVVVTFLIIIVSKEYVPIPILTGILVVLALVGALIVVGLWALVPAGIFALALVFYGLIDPGTSNWSHGVWQVLVALAVSATVYVLT